MGKFSFSNNKASYIIFIFAFALLLFSRVLVASEYEYTVMPCKPFPEPVVGSIYLPGLVEWQRHQEYLQVGPRHFKLVYISSDFPHDNPGGYAYIDASDYKTFYTIGSVSRAIEVNGMMPVFGMVYGNIGWIFVREWNPFWEFCFNLNPYSAERFIEYRQAREDFVRENGNMIAINVYDFDGTTIIDTSFQPVSY